MTHNSVIWKHELPIVASIEQKEPVPVPVPLHSSLLSIGVQRDVAVFWEVHDPKHDHDVQDLMYFLIVETGKTFRIDSSFKFLGTLQLTNYYVVHVYQKIDASKTIR